MSNKFGRLLRDLRIEKGIGLRKFALLVGELPSNLCAIETGRRTPPQQAEKLRDMAEALVLIEGASDWEEFFDAARRPGALPADVEHLTKRRMIPVLMRAISSLDITDAQLRKLVEDLEKSRRASTNEGPRTAALHAAGDRKAGKRTTAKPPRKRVPPSDRH